jgi:hypothetical protein
VLAAGGSGGSGLLAVSPSSASLASSGAAGADSNRTLYLGNLHPFVSEATLQEVFAGLGGITELKVIKDKATGVSAGYGFAKFAGVLSTGLGRRALLQQGSVLGSGGVLLHLVGRARGQHMRAACPQPAGERLLQCLTPHAPSRPSPTACAADPASAQAALDRVAKTVLFGQEARINWAFQKEQKEEVAHHFHVFVGDLSSGGRPAPRSRGLCSQGTALWGGIGPACVRAFVHPFTPTTPPHRHTAALPTIHPHPPSHTRHATPTTCMRARPLLPGCRRDGRHAARRLPALPGLQRRACHVGPRNGPLPRLRLRVLPPSGGGGGSHPGGGLRNVGGRGDG